MTRLGLRLALLALFGWLSCFFVLARRGTWLPFAFVGLLLAALMLGLGIFRRPRRRDLPASVALGVASGVAMVLLTHLGYAAVCSLWPAVRGRTAELLALLNVAGFSARDRAGLIIVIASCEEVLFRGPLPLSATRLSVPNWVWPSALEWPRLLAFTAVYALTTAPLGSPLLVLCALCCGLIWGALRIATGSLCAPILAHVIWDLGVLLIWPLPVAT